MPPTTPDGRQRYRTSDRRLVKRQGISFEQTMVDRLRAYAGQHYISFAEAVRRGIERGLDILEFEDTRQTTESLTF